MSVYTLCLYLRKRWVQCYTVWAVITVTVFSKLSKIQKIDDFVAEENDYLFYLAKNLAKTAIEHIYLQSARFTQRGINALVGVEQLKSLNLAFTDIDNATAIKLAQHPSMKQLWIHDTKITDVSSFLQNNNLVFFKAGKFGQSNEPMMSEVKIKINNNLARMGHD